MAAYRKLIASIFCASLVVSACSALDSADNKDKAGSTNVNALIVGHSAKPGEQVVVPTRWADDYNYKTKNAIIELRAKYIQEVPALFGGQYQPNHDIFGAIEDNKPWWGLAGRSVWGRGNRSMEGLSEESRFISNPYLLVGADPASANMWNRNKITKEDLDNKDFPYAWHLKSLTWWPDKCVGDAVYLVSDFNQQMFQFKDKLKVQTITPAFNLVAYNARDFGYNYIWLDEKHSTNIENVNKPKPEPVRIVQMFHCGGTCGYAGGCNNMSPGMPAIDCIKYTKLPARAAVRLWKEKPGSVEEAPDFSFFVDLE